MLKWFVNSGWWLGNRHFRECRKPRCCHPGLRAGIASVKSSWRPAGSIGSIAVIYALVFLTACTDYVSQIEDRYGEWVIDPSTVEKGLMTDSRDGQTYETVKIGTQMWMAQNLNYETANSYCYRDSAKYCSKYGRYYTWAAAKKACPSGWHLPTEADFKTLIGAVGGSSDAEGGIASYVLKSTNGWIDAGVDLSGNGTDDYSFAAFPAGIRYYSDGGYGVGSSADFWSSTEDDRDSDCAVHLNLIYTDVDNYTSGEILYGFYKENGLSVRCIKDEKFSLSATTTKSSSSQKAKSSSSSIKSSSSISQKSSSSVAKLSSSSVVKSSSSQKTVSSSSVKVTEPAEVTVGSMTDSRNGQTYKTVTIGTQTWMAENLNYETAYSYCFNNNSANCTKYGRLYTWAAAMDSAGSWSTNGKGCGYNKACSPTYPVRGVCPEGWHLPSETEWETLFTAVGGRLTAGKALKSIFGWKDDNGKSGNGTDAFSFSALSAGYRHYGGYYYDDSLSAYFWRSSEYDNTEAYRMILDYEGDDAGLDYYSKNTAFSVRCLKDEKSEQTQKSSSSTKAYSSSSVKSSSSQKTVSSSSVKVTEPAEVTLGSITDSRDGQTYKTVKIGSQIWMAENLNYKTENSWCGGGNGTAEGDCSKYGRLYTWAAAMDSVGTWSTNGKGCGYNKTCSPTYPVRGICPEGWHLPTEAEFETLFTAVGGKSTAGKVLKSTTGWTTYSGITNEDAFAFSALPAGGRDNNGHYSTGSYDAYFWSSTEDDSNDAYFMYLYYNNGDANLDNFSKYDGFSVRCLKD